MLSLRQREVCWKIHAFDCSSVCGHINGCFDLMLQCWCSQAYISPFLWPDRPSKRKVGQTRLYLLPHFADKLVHAAVLYNAKC
jgi:hypothetical protein